MKNVVALAVAICSVFTLVAALPPVELLPFTFAGRIVDYVHVAYDAETSVEVRVKTKDGTLLAKTTTATGGLAAYNYVLTVPIASQVAAGYVKVGDEVVFEFVESTEYGPKVYKGLVTSEEATIGAPGQSARVDVILATDANGDGVSDEYVETLEYMMWLNGIETYDANADYDHDGRTNYEEYVAGTNPFDATDSFSVRQMAEETGFYNYVAMKVLVSQGRTYTVSTTTALGEDVTNWARTEFSVNDPSARLQGRLSTGASETGYRIIYVKKEGDRRFWKIDVE